MEIKYLADCPQHLHEVSNWLYEEWGAWYENSSREKRLNKLKNKLNKKEVPTVFVTVIDETPVGTASLVKYDMQTKENLTPWLASVYVKKEFRRRGIGSQLVQRVTKEARDIGFEEIYLFTPDKKDFYLNLNWKFYRKGVHKDLEVDIMSKELDKLDTGGK